MSLLIDTCVISELQKPQQHAAAQALLARTPEADQYLSVITIGEIAGGIARLAAGRKRQQLQEWLLGLQHAYADRILPIDSQTAQLWGELTARTGAKGVQIGASDGLIAATALQHGLQIVTRNVRDFAASGARLLNPWEDA